MNRFFIAVLGSSLVTTVIGCGPRNGVTEPIVFENKIPGTVTESWAEPMPDVVKVPGRLDPTGTYYMPEHKAVVEIRPERYQELKYDDERKK